MPTPLSNSLQQLHAWPLQTRSLRHQRVLGAHPCSFRCSAKREESLHSSNTVQLLGLASAACLFMTSLPAHADEDITRSFNKNCIGCHVGGGNVVQAGATLKEADLQRNGAASVEAIYDLVYNGKGKMPGYGAGCAPKGKCTFGPRLSDDEIQRLSQYVVQQAEAGWQQ